MVADFSTLIADYSVWTEAYEVAITGDVQAIYDAVTYGVDSGTVFDAIMVTAGPLPNDLVWHYGGEGETGPGFLSPDQDRFLRQRVKEIPIGKYETVRGFVCYGDRLAMLAAGLMQPYETERALSIGHGGMPILVGLRSFDEARLEVLASAVSLEGLQYFQNAVPGMSNLEIADVTGASVGFLVWPPSRAGQVMLSRFAPAILLAFAGVLVLSFTTAWLFRQNLQRVIRGEASARRAAREDSLTRLPNRLAMMEWTADLDGGEGGPRRVLFIDLDRFKHINDIYGHSVGDQVIVEIAARLRGLCPPAGQVFRVGGDEFSLIVQQQDGDEPAGALAARIVEAVRGPVGTSAGVQRVDCSIGVAAGSDLRVPSEDLVRQADLAMLKVKRARAGGFCLYTPEIEAIAQRDRLRETELAKAIAAPGHFSIVYQPIVNARDSSLVRAEALARWPGSGMGPGEFIALAEASGQIVALGEVLLNQICADLARHPALEVALNISPLQLVNPAFRAVIEGCLVRHAVAPGRIEIEITEGVMVDDPALAAIKLQELRALGLSAAIDDFGIGYSSLGVVRQMPVNTLKIDGSFVRDKTEVDRNFEMIAGIARIGHAMDMKIVGEGVETEEEALRMIEAGCDHLQGYFFGRPMPIGDLMSSFVLRHDLPAGAEDGFSPAAPSLPEGRAALPHSSTRARTT